MPIVDYVISLQSSFFKALAHSSERAAMLFTRVHHRPSQPRGTVLPAVNTPTPKCFGDSFACHSYSGG